MKNRYLNDKEIGYQENLRSKFDSKNIKLGNNEN